ncbi:squalene/phytoene synthase family protein [Nitrospirillum sp. BR 11752]|uniref:squalene/phytoene synthase family protein n=1 Tax=Nitrospirillum sp. BR 11752 TaxID=3104293 RepID=UPI002EA9952F|nr:squalene/phytoene synthase family protein [Nitrospirillum sp. BR 11752]
MADFRIQPPPIGRARPAQRRPPVQGGYASALRRVPKAMRRHAAAFASFLKLAHDITGDANLEPEAKIAQLDALERALVSGGNVPSWLGPALELKASLAITGGSSLHARQLLQAFRRDAEGYRARTWGDVLAACRLAANPVGHHLLELYGESADALAATDALCTAIRLLRVVQECRDDWVRLGRCYFPLDWFDAVGASPEHLVEHRATPAIRMVLDRMLDRIDRQLDHARALPGALRDPGLRMETAVLLHAARLMAGRLRRRDPLAQGISLGPLARAWVALRARLVLARSMAGMAPTPPSGPPPDPDADINDGPDPEQPSRQKG